jgi:hypothetical protein
VQRAGNAFAHTAAAGVPAQLIHTAVERIAATAVSSTHPAPLANIPVPRLHMKDHHDVDTIDAFASDSAVTPEACPRWSKCSAGLCPLGSSGPTGRHVKGDPTCHFARTAVKAGGPESIALQVGPAFAEAVVRAIPAYRAAHPQLGGRLTEAARSGLRVSNLPHLKPGGATAGAAP